MCSDGVWEFLSNEKVLKEFLKFPRNQIQVQLLLAAFDKTLLTLRGMF